MTGAAKLGQMWLGAGIVLFAGLVWSQVSHPIVGPVLAVLPIAAAVALRQPFLLGILFIVFSYFRIHEVFPVLMPLRLPLLLAMGTLGALAWNVAFRKIKLFWDPLFLPFSAFFLVVTAGIFISSNPGNSLAYWKDTYVKIAIMVFAIAWLARKPEDLMRFTRLVLLAGGVVAVIALRNEMNGIDLVEGTRVTIGRGIGSVLGDPNDLALVLLFPAGFAIAALLQKGLPKMDRLMGLAVCLLSGPAIIATQSRGGLLGVLTVAGVFAAQRVRSKALLAAVGAVALLALFAVAGVDDRQSGGAHEEGIDESAMGRVYAWKAAFRMALSHPLQGVGVDNFYYNYYLFSDFWDGKNHAVHSTWFGVLGETGFVGLVIFVWMMIAVFRSLRQCTRTLANDAAEPIVRATANGLFAAFVGFCVSGTFLTQGFTWPVYIILGLAVAVNRFACPGTPRQFAAEGGSDTGRITSTY